MAWFKKQSRKKVVLLVLAFSLLGGGIWLTSTTGFKLLYGYFLYKTTPVEATAVTSIPTKEKKEETPAYKMDVSDWQPTVGEDMGTLTIPKLNATIPIIHGTGEDELDKGVGHFADSVLPGEADNSVLSGHRDTV